MASANTIDISEFQDPSTFDYQAAKNAGINTIIIRGSVSMRLDKHAKEHIANAKKYGFHWHLYHYYYGGSGEANYAVQAAQELGLSSSQYLFLDMEDSSLPTDWATSFEIFRQKAKSHFKVGLYCSDSPYQAKFNDTTLKQEGVARWVASYSYEPKNYDIWQMSGAGSGGFGTYTGDVDRDYDKAGVLTSNSSSDQPKTPTGPANPGYRAIILEDGIDTDAGIYGRGCSYDNGKTFKVYWTPYGRKYYQEDADNLYPFFKKYLGIRQVPWSSITDKPDLALKSDIPSTIDWSKVTNKPDVSKLATKTDLAGYYTKLQIDTTLANHGLVRDKIVNPTAAQVKDKKSSITTITYDGSIPDDKRTVATVGLPSPCWGTLLTIRNDNDLYDSGTQFYFADDTSSYKRDKMGHTSEWQSWQKLPQMTDIPSLTGYAKLTDLPNTSSFATTDSLNEVRTTAESAESRAESAYSLASTALSDVQATTQVPIITSGTLADLANNQGSYHYEIDFIPSDSPTQDWGLLDVVVGANYAKQVFTNTANSDVYVRTRKQGVWSAWRKVTLWN